MATRGCWVGGLLGSFFESLEHIDVTRPRGVRDGGMGVAPHWAFSSLCVDLDIEMQDIFARSKLRVERDGRSILQVRLHINHKSSALGGNPPQLGDQCGRD